MSVPPTERLAALGIRPLGECDGYDSIVKDYYGSEQKGLTYDLAQEELNEFRQLAGVINEIVSAADDDLEFCDSTFATVANIAIQIGKDTKVGKPIIITSSAIPGETIFTALEKFVSIKRWSFSKTAIDYALLKVGNPDQLNLSNNFPLEEEVFLLLPYLTQKARKNADPYDTQPYLVVKGDEVTTVFERRTLTGADGGPEAAVTISQIPNVGRVVLKNGETTSSRLPLATRLWHRKNSFSLSLWATRAKSLGNTDFLITGDKPLGVIEAHYGTSLPCFTFGSYPAKPGEPPKEQQLVLAKSNFLPLLEGIIAGMPISHHWQANPEYKRPSSLKQPLPLP